MVKMKNQDVIEAFVNYNIQPGIESHTGNLYIELSGRKLMNYNTVLAQRIGDKLYVNKTKYSVTTSKIQTYLYRAIDWEYGVCTNKVVYITEYVPEGTQSLERYVKTTV